MHLSKYSILKLPHLVSRISCVSFHPCNPSVCIASSNEVFEFDLLTSSHSQKLSLESSISHIVHSKISPQLLCFLNSGKVVIYDLLTSQYKGCYFPVTKRQKSKFSLVGVCPNRPVIYFTRHHGNRLFELNYQNNLSSKRVSSIAHKRGITALTVHPKGHGIFTGQLDGMVNYLSMKRICLLQFSEGSGRIISTEEQKAKKIIDPKRGAPVSVIRFGPFPQKNSTIILTATRRGKVRVWQIFTVSQTVPSKSGGKKSGKNQKQKQKKTAPSFKIVCLSECSFRQNAWIQNVLFPSKFPFPCCLTETGEMFFLKTNHIISSFLSNPYTSKPNTVVTKRTKLDTLPRSFIRPFYAGQVALSSTSSKSKLKKRNLVQMELNKSSGDFIFFGVGKTDQVKLFRFLDVREESPIHVDYPVVSKHHHYLDSDYLNNSGVVRHDHPSIFYFDRSVAFPQVLATEQSIASATSRNLAKTKKSGHLSSTIIIPQSSKSPESHFYRLQRATFSPRKDVALMFFQSEVGAGKGSYIQYLTSSKTTVGGMKNEGGDGAFCVDFYDSYQDSKTIPFVILSRDGKKLIKYPEAKQYAFSTSCCIDRIFYILDPRPKHQNKKKKKKKKSKSNSPNKSKDCLLIHDMPFLYHERERNCVVKSKQFESIDPDFTRESVLNLDEKERFIECYPQAIYTAILTNQRLVITATESMGTIIGEHKFCALNSRVISCIWVGTSLLFFNSCTTLHQFDCSNSIFSKHCSLDFNHAVLVSALLDRIVFSYINPTDHKVMLGARYINLFDTMIRKNPKLFYTASQSLSKEKVNNFNASSSSSKSQLPICHDRLRKLVSFETLQVLVDKGYVDIASTLFDSSRFGNTANWTFKYTLLLHQLEFEKCYELLISRHRTLEISRSRAGLKKREFTVIDDKFRDLGMVCLDYRNFEFAFLCFRKVCDLELLFSLYCKTGNTKGMLNLYRNLHSNNNNTTLRMMCEMYFKKNKIDLTKKKEEEVEGEEEEEEEDVLEGVKKEFPKFGKVGVTRRKWDEAMIGVSGIGIGIGIKKENEKVSKIPISIVNYRKVKTQEIQKDSNKDTEMDDGGDKIVFFEDSSEKMRLVEMSLSLDWLKPELLRHWIGASYIDITSPLSKIQIDRERADIDSDRDYTDSTSASSSVATSPMKAIGKIGRTGRPRKSSRSKPEDNLPDFSMTDVSTGADTYDDSGLSSDSGSELSESESMSETTSIAGMSEASGMSGVIIDPVSNRSTSLPPHKGVAEKPTSQPIPTKSGRARTSTNTLALPSKANRSVTPDMTKSPSRKVKGRVSGKKKQVGQIEEETEGEEDSRVSGSRSVEKEGNDEFNKYGDWSESSGEEDEGDKKMSALKKIRIKEVKEVDEEEQERKLRELSMGFGGGFGAPPSSSSSGRNRRRRRGGKVEEEEDEKEGNEKDDSVSFENNAPSAGGGRRGRRAKRLAKLQELKNSGASNEMQGSVVSQRLRKQLGVKTKTTKKEKKKKKKKVRRIVKLDGVPVVEDMIVIRKIEKQIKGFDKVKIWQMIQRMVNNPNYKKYRHTFVVVSYLIRDLLSKDQTEIMERRMLIPAVKCLLYLKMMICMNKLIFEERENGGKDPVKSKESVKRLAFISFHMARSVSELGESMVAKAREIAINCNLKAMNWKVCEELIEEAIESLFDDTLQEQLEKKLAMCKEKGGKNIDTRLDDPDTFMFCWDSFKCFDASQDPHLECSYCHAKYLKNEEEEISEKSKCDYCIYGTLEGRN